MYTVSALSTSIVTYVVGLCWPCKTFHRFSGSLSDLFPRCIPWYRIKLCDNVAWNFILKSVIVFFQFFLANGVITRDRWERRGKKGIKIELKDRINLEIVRRWFSSLVEEVYGDCLDLEQLVCMIDAMESMNWPVESNKSICMSTT